MVSDAGCQCIYEISPAGDLVGTTDVATATGSLPGGPFATYGGLAYDAGNRTLYAGGDNNVVAFSRTPNDLVISIAVTSSRVVVGGDVVFSVEVENNSSTDASNTKVDSVLGKGLEFISTSGCFGDPNGVPVCTNPDNSIGLMPAGSTHLFTITARVLEQQDTGVTVSVSSDLFEENESNNEAFAQPDAVAVVIPALGSFSLMLLAILLAGFGFVVMRNRRLRSVTT